MGRDIIGASAWLFGPSWGSWVSVDLGCLKWPKWKLFGWGYPGISMEMHGNRKLGFHEDISHAGHTHVSDEALNSLKILKLLRDCLHGKWKDISAATLVDIFRISRPNWCVLKSCYGMLWSCWETNGSQITEHFHGNCKLEDSLIHPIFRHFFVLLHKDTCVKTSIDVGMRFGLPMIMSALEQELRAKVRALSIFVNQLVP